MNEELFCAPEALTFDDVLVVPAFSEILPSEVSVQARLTREITLNVPILSAAMDTVSEARLAIALARELDNPRDEAFALTALGDALSAEGQFAGAEEAFEKAIEIRTRLGEKHLLPDSQAGLARLYLACHDSVKASQQAGIATRRVNPGLGIWSRSPEPATARLGLAVPRAV